MDPQEFAARLSAILRDAANAAGLVHVSLEVPERMKRLEQEHADLVKEFAGLKRGCHKLAAALIGTWITIGAALVVLGAILVYRVAQ